MVCFESNSCAGKQTTTVAEYNSLDWLMCWWSIFALIFQTIPQKPCADSRTVGCNGAVSSTKSILPPCLLLSPSFSLCLSLTLYAPSADENKSPKRMPASDWLSHHRSEQEWERERGEKEDATLVSQHPNTVLKAVRLADTSAVI